MAICPNLEFAFQILGKKWNGFILHYLSTNEQMEYSFSELKKGITNITPRALSSCLQELMEYGLVSKEVTLTPSTTISYRLTDQGSALVQALRPVQQWAYDYKKSEKENSNEK
ncbi:winged helix-turn-helix transcriptional regulator [Psychrobacillus sp. NPDC096623]|uniref:winged helix-turn-helix transcriptional regulator n=1 Tax=Psychrobacillus sp. NPDC096623 TaxID=3364492 RepID=UPI00380AD5B2